MDGSLACIEKYIMFSPSFDGEKLGNPWYSRFENITVDSNSVRGHTLLLSRLGQKAMLGSYESRNGLPVSVKGGKFLEYLLLK
jgi:hypothetical protein